MFGGRVEPYHACHWPGCGQMVKPYIWGCKPHWYALPITLRSAILHAVRYQQTNALAYALHQSAVDKWAELYEEGVVR